MPLPEDWRAFIGLLNSNKVLILNKQRTRRAQDIADLEALEESE